MSNYDRMKDLLVSEAQLTARFFSCVLRIEWLNQNLSKVKNKIKREEISKELSANIQSFNNVVDLLTDARRLLIYLPKEEEGKE